MKLLAVDFLESSVAVEFYHPSHFEHYNSAKDPYVSIMWKEKAGPVYIYLEGRPVHIYHQNVAAHTETTLMDK